MSEKPEALQAAESLEQAIQFYSAGLENSDNHMTLLAFSADKFRRLHAENERLREALRVCLAHWFKDDNPDELQENVAKFKELCGWENKP